MIMRFRILTVCIFLVALLGVAHAQTAVQPQPKPRRFLMWKATSPTATVYLVGSIHVGDSGMYPLPQQLESAFATAKVLAVELNLKNSDQGKMTELVQKYGVYGQGDGLSKHLSKETSAALDAFCTQHELPREGVEQFKPWFVAVNIAA